MNEAFEQFKSTAGSLAEDTMKEAPKRFDGWICSQDIGAWTTWTRLQYVEKWIRCIPKGESIVWSAVWKGDQEEKEKRNHQEPDLQEDEIYDEMDMHE
jgi:hypothetical protein